MDNGKNLVPPDRRPGDPLLEPMAQPLERDDRRGYAYGYGYGGAKEEPGGFNIGEYWRIVRKSRWIIISLVVVITTIVTIAAYKVDDQYVASAQIQIEDPNRNNILAKEGLYIDLQGNERYYKTQLRLLQSADLARRVTLELDLEHNPNFLSHKPQTLPSAIVSLVRPQPGAPPIEPTLTGPKLLVDMNQPLDGATIQRLVPYASVVLGGLNVEEIPTTQLVTISFQHHDPVIAAKVANSVAENFVKDNLNKRVDSKATASDFVQRRVAELQAQIRAGEERLLNYARSHEILSLDAEQNPTVERLSELNNQVLKAEAEVQALQATREAMKQAGMTDVMRWPIAQRDEGAAEVSRALSVLKQRRLELSQKYTDEYPEVKKVDGQIAQLEGDLTSAKKRLAAEAEAEYQAAVIREKGLRALFAEQRGEVMQQNEAAISYRMLQQEVETNTTFLNTLLERQKGIDVSAASEVNNVTLKDRALAPGDPIGPDRSRWILVAFVASLVGGVGLAFGREYLDQTIRSLDDIERYARLPSLGVIPALNAGITKRTRRDLATQQASNGDGSTGLVKTLEAKSAAAEAYRHLRTSVLLSSAGHPGKLLLVTSSQPREGKTTTAVNTAISLAQTGASVVVVDCDMRKPRVHHLLNVKNRDGISLYLTGQNEDLASLIQPHQIANLSVLPCGPVPPNPAELLGSDQMRKLLDELSEQFDHVMIDTPPVISFADAVILSTMVDGVILVVRGGSTNKGVLLRTRQILGDVGAQIYGVVLNDADMKYRESYYYNYKTYNSQDRRDASGGTGHGPGA
jgi:succinoglycan biosynthesis transport protein ExoP